MQYVKVLYPCGIPYILHKKDKSPDITLKILIAKTRQNLQFKYASHVSALKTMLGAIYKFELTENRAEIFP